MKKTFAILVLCMFMISMIPMAFAENGKNGKYSTQDDEENEIDEPKMMADSEGNTINSIRKAVMAGEREIESLKAEEFRLFQQEQLNKAIELCKETSNDSTKCEEKLQKRTELVQKLQEKDLTRLQKLVELKNKAIERFNEMKDESGFQGFDKDKEFKVRELIKEKKEKSNLNYLNAKARVDEAKAKHLTLKADLAAKLAERKVCKEADDCEEKDKELKIKARDMTSNAADQTIKMLEKVLANVESSEYITEENTIVYKGWLNQEIEDINDVKAKIAALNENSTKEEVNAAMKEMKNAIADAKLVIKSVNARLVNSRMGGVIIKSKYLEVKLNRIMERMTENGKDTTAIQPLVDQFKAKLDTAKAEFQAAQMELDKKVEAKLADTDKKAIDEYVKAAEQHMKLAKQALADAQKILQQIIKSVVSNEGVEELAESNTDAAESAVEGTA